MKQILENTDLFSYNINFTYRKKNSFYTILSGIISIIVYGIFIYFINYFSRDFIYSENPKINFKQSKYENDLDEKNLSNIFIGLNYSGIMKISTSDENINLNKTLSNSLSININWIDYRNLKYYAFKFSEAKVLWLEKDEKNVNNDAKNKTITDYYLGYNIYVDNKTKFIFDFSDDMELNISSKHIQDFPIATYINNYIYFSMYNFTDMNTILEIVEKKIFFIMWII